MRDLLSYSCARRLQDRFPVMLRCLLLPAVPSPIALISVALEPGGNTRCEVVDRKAAEVSFRTGLMNQAAHPFDIRSPDRRSEGRRLTDAAKGVFRPGIPFDSPVTTGHSRTLSPWRNHAFRNL